MKATELTDQQWEQVEAQLFAGRKVEAIKLFREFTETGLKEAKDAVDDHEKHLRAQFPDRFKPGGSGGCMGAILLLLPAGIGTGTLVVRQLVGAG